MTRPPAFITSVDVRPSGGPHEYVTIFIRGQNVGTLCVGKGDAKPLALLLLPGMKPEEPTPGDTPWPPGVEVRTATDDEQRQALARHPWPPGDRARIEEEERRSCERAERNAIISRRPRGWPPIERVIGIDPAGADHRQPRVDLAQLLIQAKAFAEQWRDQEGCSGHLLDQLADTIEAYCASRPPGMFCMPMAGVIIDDPIKSQPVVESEESGFVCSQTALAYAKCGPSPELLADVQREREER